MPSIWKMHENTWWTHTVQRKNDWVRNLNSLAAGLLPETTKRKLKYWHSICQLLISQESLKPPNSALISSGWRSLLIRVYKCCLKSINSWFRRGKNRKDYSCSNKHIRLHWKMRSHLRKNRFSIRLLKLSLKIRCMKKPSKCTMIKSNWKMVKTVMKKV